MSAQGGTLHRRGTIELPIWPVAVLVVAAVAAAIGMTLLRDAGQTRFVTSVTDRERLSNSTAAVREQGAVAPAIPSIRPIDLSVLENSSAAVREQGAVLPQVVGISHVAPSLHSVGYAGFENPGAYVIEAPAFAGFENPSAYTAAWDSVGGPNEALHRQYSPPQEGVGTGTGSDPIIVNGEPCMQCR
jgi:hypothetical protein